ncbi:MarR family winged helix-turn-helix transcriptional regulator [Streptococcus gallinaceus]|uniref:DNA-binding MarR family transcriptional regulator n=1 Tax=Streptococcus gallinaceus TaxID=165758 RepID=A0ABV2JJH4_9STRE|nr:MarR family transcriptional regulator [Streptococcus gallinaceus]MCP1638992.1 DNA-binding MarR family transcriptional regulator [Streptococcus gallinaceus]MCP1769764.1 DNA-binding MarR family transcriptional regulator [Streptococcus gallinaceus]
MKKESIGVLVKMAELAFERVSNRRTQELDLTTSQFRILKFLTTHPDQTIRQIDIEKRFGMTNPTVTGILQNLEKKGMIKRIASTEDKRSKHVSATSLAMEKAQDIARISQEIEAELTAHFSKEEKETLSQLLQKLLFKEREDEK